MITNFKHHIARTLRNLFPFFFCYVPVKGEIIWYLSLTVWLISLNIMLSSFFLFLLKILRLNSFIKNQPIFMEDVSGYVRNLGIFIHIFNLHSRVT